VVVKGINNTWFYAFGKCAPQLISFIFSALQLKWVREKNLPKLASREEEIEKANK
jgi:hypothetical protein